MGVGGRRINPWKTNQVELNGKGERVGVGVEEGKQKKKLVKERRHRNCAALTAKIPLILERKNTHIYPLLHLFMHPLVDSCRCSDQNPPAHQQTELPAQIQMMD